MSCSYLRQPDVGHPKFPSASATLRFKTCHMRLSNALVKPNVEMDVIQTTRYGLNQATSGQHIDVTHEF